jgi:hypothetical protein
MRCTSLAHAQPHAADACALCLWRCAGNLHFYGVGGKSAAMRLCSPTGGIMVTTRKPRPGLLADVCELQLDKPTCMRREVDMLAHNAMEVSQRDAVKAPPSMFNMPGGERQARDVEKGLTEAPDGGKWHGSGTLVQVTDLDANLVHELTTQGGMAKLQQLVAEVYYAYIHNNEARRCFAFVSCLRTA